MTSPEHLTHGWALQLGRLIGEEAPCMTEDESEALRRTKERYARENKLKTRWGHDRHYLSTPEGHKVAQLLVTPIADHLSGKYGEAPRVPQSCSWLQRIDPDLLALMGLAPVLNRLAHDAREGGYNASRPMLFRKAIGDHLRDYLPGLEATASERARAGHWIMRCMHRAGVLMDVGGYPKITPIWQGLIDEYREGLIRAHPALQPHFREPPPWTGWRNHYEDRLSATFVNDWDTHTQTAIEAAFRDQQSPFRLQHVAVVSALERVRLTLDPVMVDLAEKFAVKLMGHGGKKRRNDRITVKYDLATARYCISQPAPDSPFAKLAHLGTGQAFWLSYSTDFRGRLSPYQKLCARGSCPGDVSIPQSHAAWQRWPLLVAGALRQLRRIDRQEDLEQTHCMGKAEPAFY
jgi:hypothetical protein